MSTRRSIAFAMALVSVSLFSIVANAQRLPIKTYTSAEGLAQNLVLRIVRDSRGYLWFCTAEGLSRFDGYSFTNYTTENGLPHRSIRDLLETKSGIYWIATANGLVRFNPDGNRASPAKPMFETFFPETSPEVRNIYVLYEDSNGTIWCGTRAGLYRLEEVNNQIQFHFVDVGIPIEGEKCLIDAVIEDRKGNLWIGTRGSGLYRRSANGRAEHYGTKQGLSAMRVNTLFVDKQGRLWVGTTLGLYLMKSDANADSFVVAQAFNKGTGLSSDWIESIFESSDGRFWIALAGGLAEMVSVPQRDESHFRTYGTTQGLTHLDLTSLAEDSAGNLWIGATAGAMKLARNGFVSYNQIDGKPFSVGGVIETKQGELCLIRQVLDSSELGLLHFGVNGLSTIRPKFPKGITYFGFGWNQIGMQDHEGDYWLATGQGLFRFPSVDHVEQLAVTSPKAVYTKKNGLLDDLVWRIFEDSRGDVWIANTSAPAKISRWERATNSFHHYPQPEEVPSGSWPKAFAEDFQGNVWIAIGDKLIRYSQRQFKVIPTSRPSEIHNLHVDSHGRLWIATDSAGLMRLDKPDDDNHDQIRYTMDAGLSSNQVWALTSDVQGDIYAFTGRGVDRINPTSSRIKRYTIADGLVGGAPKAAFRDRHGTLWFGTDIGVSMFNPREEIGQQHLPILISSLRVGASRKQISELGETALPEFLIAPSDNQVQIDFVGLSFALGEQLKYQYKLEGADLDWGPPTEQRSVNYAQLAPGSYRFLVRAMASDGSLSPVPASASFTILRPVWQRWWFLVLVILAVTLLAYALYRYRLSRLLELERVRMRIATDLHDDIGSNLSLIAMVSEVAHRGRQPVDDQMSGWLSLIANTSRETVDSMSDIVWAINPAKDRLLDLTQRMRSVADDVLTARNIGFTFSAPDQEADKYLGADTRREVFMIFKEAINNVARHADCTHVNLTLSVQNGCLYFEAKDNGKGFDPSTVNEGNGLASMRRRAQNLNAVFSIDSEAGKGTSVSLSIPLKGRPALVSK